MKTLEIKNNSNNIVFQKLISQNKKVKKNFFNLVVATRINEFDLKSNHKESIDFSYRFSRFINNFGDINDSISRKELYKNNIKNNSPRFNFKAEYTGFENYFILKLNIEIYKDEIVETEKSISELFEYYINIYLTNYFSDNKLQEIIFEQKQKLFDQKNKANFYLFKHIYKSTKDDYTKYIASVNSYDDTKWITNNKITELKNKFINYIFNPVDGYVFSQGIADSDSFVDDVFQLTKKTYKNQKFVKPFKMISPQIKIDFESTTIKAPKLNSSLLLTVNYFDQKIIDHEMTVSYINTFFGMGGGSWLFTEVREKLESGYSVYGMIENNLENILTFSNISNDKYDVVLKRINELLVDLKDGKFEEDLLESEKFENIKNIENIDEDPKRLSSHLIKMYWNKFNSFEEYIEAHKNITIDDLKKATEKLNLNTKHIFVKGLKNE